MPGSHRLHPLELEAAADREDGATDSMTVAANLARAENGARSAVWGGVQARTLSFPPGSVVFLDARTYHGVTPHRADSTHHRRFFSAVQ